MNDPRYYVSELEGFLAAKVGGADTPGLSCMVIDRWICHRVTAIYRTEDQARPGGRGRLTRLQQAAYVRQLAGEHAARLNG